MSSAARIFQPDIFSPGSEVTLNSENSHYLISVLRARLGDAVVLINGMGGEFSAHIIDLQRRSVTLLLDSYCATERESPLAITLLQGLSKGEKMDFTIQKSCELGVQRIIPVITERSVVRLDAKREEKRQQHWQGVAIAASLQCGRNRIAAVDLPISFKEAVANSGDGLKLLLSPHHAGTALGSVTKPQHLTLLIGPEGGLTADEISSATAAGYLPLNLGSRILRTETAALVAMAILQWQWGDLG
ncbi:MAG: 16S rRNA (uracil(1498)-N(3))-methyltransferase [Gammaproteobacteria bacterium]|nr:16S rRNA (uracil(1498)-N(3))-methyltransferase [Gammaproteobacteria bacterium]